MASYIQRRKFLATLLGGAAAAWPMAARGQHTSVRHIGVLMYGFANGETARFLLDPLRDGLRELGWRSPAPMPRRAKSCTGLSPTPANPWPI